jgi:hypothetical protein
MAFLLLIDGNSLYQGRMGPMTVPLAPMLCTLTRRLMILTKVRLGPD